jgi:hypothetical protein
MIVMYENVTAKEGEMDGKRRSLVIDNDRPIARPDFPLPALFSPSKRSELPTRRRQQDTSRKRERAHFYRKRTSQDGSPVYGFYITSDTSGRDARTD